MDKRAHGKKLVPVLFVDYGEVGQVDPTRNEIHKSVEFEELPILCFRCRLHKVVPVGGVYNDSFLEEVTSDFIESIVKVQAKPASRDHTYKTFTVLNGDNENYSIILIPLSRHTMYSYHSVAGD